MKNCLLPRCINYAVLFSSALPAFASTTYITDGKAPAVYAINTSTHTATQTVSNTLTPSFSQPNGIALSPDGSFAYVTDWVTQKLYYINTATNIATQFVSSFTVAGLGGIAISPNSQYAYATSYIGNAVYYINVAANNSPSTITNGYGFSGPVGVAISLNGKFAYILQLTSPAVFYVNTATNQVTAKVSGSFLAPRAIAISPDCKVAYIADSTAKALFSIDTETNIATSFSSCTFSAPEGVAVSPDGNTIYLADSTAQAIYYINKDTRTIFRQVNITFSANDWAINNLAISPDGQSLYVAGGDAGNMWYIDIPSGTATAIANATGVAYNSPTAPATLPPLLPTTTIFHGNNLAIASYLNANAPYISTVLPLVTLTNTEKAEALESISPARNSCSTFASQIAQLATGRTLYDHLRQNRFFTPRVSPNLAFVASAKEDLPPSPCTNPPSCIWMSGFGQYAHEKSDNQLPAFDMSSGGVLIGGDRTLKHATLGLGGAYVYTHVHEEDGGGSANINQGALSLYGTFWASQWYFDIALWGGYYHTDNTRKISYPSFSSNASSSPHGWQFTPHLEISYQYKADWFRITPYISADFINCWESAFSESGASPFNARQQNRYSSLLQSGAGLYFEEILSYKWGTVTFMEQGGYAYQKAFHPNITASFIGMPSSFVVAGLAPTQNLGIVDFEVLLTPKYLHCPYGSINTHAEWGSKYQVYQGTLELGFDF